jgi:hypothetical protein
MTGLSATFCSDRSLCSSSLRANCKGSHTSLTPLRRARRRHAQGRRRPSQRVDKRLDEGDVDPNAHRQDASYVDARTLMAGVLDGSAKRRDAPPNPNCSQSGGHDSFQR